MRYAVQSSYCLNGLSDSCSHFPFMPRKDILSDIKEEEEEEEHTSEISSSVNTLTLISSYTAEQERTISYLFTELVSFK